MNAIALFINTFFYVGKIPVAPGTTGSLVALILWFFLNPTVYTMMLLLIFTILFSYYTISITLSNLDEKDPQYIVIDEVIGMWIALMFIPANSVFNVSVAFILFRFFDIMKPSIIYRSQFISATWGILLDDIIAGSISGLIVFGIASI